EKSGHKKAQEQQKKTEEEDRRLSSNPCLLPSFCAFCAFLRLVCLLPRRATRAPMTTPSLPRSAGVLLHPTSLPGPFGIGDLGPTAYRWVETLAGMRQSWWQVLPLGPTGAGDSPYQSFSAFAGNVNLLSPELLEREGLVSNSLWAGQHFPDDRVDF